MRTKTTTTTFLVLLGLWLQGQDPKPAKSATPTAEPQQAATGQEPAKARPVPGAPKRHRYEGVYRLTRRVVGGLDDPRPSEGYLAITGKHLFVNLASPGIEDEHPLVHAGVREWREHEDGMRTTTRLDFLSDSEGEIHLVPRGKEEVRRIELLQGGLRVMQGERSWLEFERVE